MVAQDTPDTSKTAGKRQPHLPQRDASNLQQMGRGVPTWLAWLLIPLLAVAAYYPVLGMWFVADDFGHLRAFERVPGLTPFQLFESGSMFYRPLSTVLTWNVGHYLFGTDALGYHALSLILHALAAWLLGRATAVIAGSTRTGWIAGALFGVYPLSTEPVAWLAAQWDVWAAVCALAATWGFASYWRTGSRWAYTGGLAAASIGVMMKESTLPLPLALIFVALATESSVRKRKGRSLPQSWGEWVPLARRAILTALPFAVPSMFFLALRIGGGGIGGYPTAARDYENFFWDSLVSAGLRFLSPLNRSVFSPVFAQVLGSLMTLLLLTGLALWGRRHWLLLLLGGAWTLIFLVPVLNITLNLDPENMSNRLLYFSFMGFCIVMALFFSEWLAMPKVWQRRAGVGLLVALLLFCVPATWLQLEPWRQSSRQARYIVNEMDGLIYKLPGRRVHLKVANTPREYKGSYLFWNGLDDAMSLLVGQQATVEQVGKLNSRAITEEWEKAGVYNLAFDFDAANELFRVSEIEGVTVAAPPPTKADKTWDYTRCLNPESGGWQVLGAALQCMPKSEAPPLPDAPYIRFEPASPDANLVAQDVGIDLTGARWVRLAVCARAGQGAVGRIGEWFWQADGQRDWAQSRSWAFQLNPANEWYTYWQYVPAATIGTRLTALRLDPVNAQVPIDLAWASVEAIR